MALTLAHIPTDDAQTALIAAQGAIDLAHAHLLDAAFDEVTRAGKRHVVLDLSGVRYVNSTGIAALVKAAQAFEAAGGGLALLGVTEKVRVVIEMLGLEQVFSVVCKERPLARV